MNPLEITTPLVSVAWLTKHLDHPELIILDATIKKVANNSEEVYPNIKIKNARFFDIKKAFSDTTTDIANMLPAEEEFSKACRNLGISNHHKIVVYDKLGIYSSARVWWMFKTMGHHQVAILDGGLPAWQRQNLACEPETNQNQYDQGNFEGTFNPNLLVNSDIVLSKIHSNDTLILDARSSDRFMAKVPEPRASLKGGHIPSSKNLPYTNVLQDGQMLTPEKLKEVFANFNIENKKLIFTCGSGITACIIMMAAALAGYENASVYDGSWSEWGQLNDVPIDS